MKDEGLKGINKRAKQLEEEEVFGMGDDISTSMPVGCTTIFDTGWETNPRPTQPIGNCVPSAADFTSCAGPCWWPAQVPDAITNFPKFQDECLNVSKDWRRLDFVVKR